MKRKIYKYFLFLLAVGALVFLVGLLILKFAFPPVYEDGAELRKDRYNHTAMRNITVMLNQFEKQKGSLPSSEDGLDVVFQMVGIPHPQDAWGREFRYSLDSDGVSFKLWTYGRDGKPGGKNEDKDLYFLE